MAKRRKRGSGSVHLRKDGRWEGRANVGVGVQGEGCPAVTQDAGERLGVHAAGQRMGRECVPEIVKSDAFFYTELTTGLRLGEICGLRWEDFDAEHGIQSVSAASFLSRRHCTVLGGSTILRVPA